MTWIKSSNDSRDSFFFKHDEEAIKQGGLLMEIKRNSGSLCFYTELVSLYCLLGSLRSVQ